MDNLTNAMAAMASKPVTGITIGLGATILTWLGVITTVFGALAAVIGCAAAIYSLIHNRNKVLRDRQWLKKIDDYIRKN